MQPFFNVLMRKINKIFGNIFVVWIIAGISCLLWGSAFPMIKIGYESFRIDSNDVGTIILFAGIRFILAGILTIVIFSFGLKKFLIPRRSSLKNIATLSLFQTILQYVFFYLGLAHSTGVKSSIVNGTSSFILLIISSFIFKQERLNGNKILGSVLGFLGVFIAGFFGSKERFGLQIGDLLILLSAVSYSFSSAFMKKACSDENPPMLSGYQFVFGGIIMTLIGSLMGGKIELFNIRGVVILIYLALVSAIAYSLWSILLKYNDVSRIGVCGSLTPIFGFVLSYVLLGENNGSLLFNLIGLSFVVSGMIIVNVKKKKDA